MADIEAVLKKKTEEGLIRMLRPISCRNMGRVTINKKSYIDFSSNDYLGLSQIGRASCRERVLRLV